MITATITALTGSGTGSAQLIGVTAAAALLLGPPALWLAHAHQLRPTRLGWATTAATTAATGLLAAAVALAAVAPAGEAGAAVAVPMLAIGLPAALVDAHEQRLPDALTAPLLATTLLTAAVTSAVTGDWRAGLRGVLVAVLLSGAALAVKGVRPGVIGWGDIKLLPSLGVVLGWAGWTTTVHATALWAILLLATALATAVFRTAARAGRRRAAGCAGTEPGGGSSTVPYGPVLLAGVAAALGPGG